MVENKIIKNLPIPGKNKNVSIGDIWLCKSEYTISKHELYKAPDEYVVYVVSDIDELDGEEFIRVQPISKKVEYKSNEDILVEDHSFLSSPFIIETWNEQPILVDLLHKKMGNTEFTENTTYEEESLSKKQIQFRKDEIRRTGYLRQSILSTMNIQEQRFLHKRRIKTFRTLSIAASIVGVFFMAWQPGRLNNSDYLKKHNQEFSSNITFGTMDNVVVRGNDCFLSGFESEECEIIKKGIESYDVKQYVEAINQFNQIESLDQRNLELYFYLSISQYFADYTEEAIQSLEKISKHNKFKYHADVLYYLSLAYVKDNHNNKARRTIKTLKNNYPSYYQNKKDLLDDLRIFPFPLNRH